MRIRSHMRCTCVPVPSDVVCWWPFGVPLKLTIPIPHVIGHRQEAWHESVLDFFKLVDERLKAWPLIDVVNIDVPDDSLLIHDKKGALTDSV